MIFATVDRSWSQSIFTGKVTLFDTAKSATLVSPRITCGVLLRIDEPVV